MLPFADQLSTAKPRQSAPASWMTATGNGSAWTLACWRISCGANEAATPSAAVSAALSVINRRVEFVAGRLPAASSSSAAAGRRVGAFDVHHPAVDEYV